MGGEGPVEGSPPGEGEPAKALSARVKPSWSRWAKTHRLQAFALFFMVASIALYFLVQAFAAGGALGAALAVGCFCLSAYCADQGYRIYHSEGFWRTYDFYKTLGPLIAEWKLLEKRIKLEKWNDERKRKAYDAFHVKAAPKIYEACISLGGIFIKMGQIAGSTFSFMLQSPYVVALEPLQDAVPPRSYEAIAAIIKDDTGKEVDDMFESFDREPVGTASIAQAHKATLSRPFCESVGDACPWLLECRDVVVKIQYPEIARLYRVDFENIVFIAELVAPKDGLDAIYDIQERHLEELDFTREAWNLRTVGANMTKGGFMPSKVVVPQPVPGLITPCVLVMQFLKGPSLKNVINEHLEERAKHYGFDDVLKFKMFVQKEGKKQRDDELYCLEHGVAEAPQDVELTLEEDRYVVDDDDADVGPNVTKLKVNLAREKAPRLVNAVAKAGVSLFPSRFDRDTWLPDDAAKRKKRLVENVRVEDIVDTMVAAHGHQLLVDGLVNLDPHPGNVLVLEGGRLGLIDYGQVRKFDAEERERQGRARRASLSLPP